MENTSTLKIEAGKFYQTRDGRKVRVYATDGEGPYVAHGAVKCSDGWVRKGWTIKGFFFSDEEENPADIIAPWIDKPEVDWSKMPEGCDSVAMDANRRWYAYPKTPALGVYHWIAPKDSIPMPLYPQHCPKWTGDWRDSLVLREGNV